MLAPPPLRSERIELRPWRLADAPALAVAWNDPAIVPAGSPERIHSVDDARRWIAGCPDRIASDRALDLVISPIDGTVVWGEVGLIRSRVRRRAAEIGYWTIASQRSRGVATEAVGLLTAWALGDGDLDVIAARCDPGDGAAIAVAARAGYEPVPASGEMVVLIACRTGSGS